MTKERNHAYLILGLCGAGVMMTQITAASAEEALEKAMDDWEGTTTFPVKPLYVGRGRYAENELQEVLKPKEETTPEQVH